MTGTQPDYELDQSVIEKVNTQVSLLKRVESWVRKVGVEKKIAAITIVKGVKAYRYEDICGQFNLLHEVVAITNPD